VQSEIGYARFLLSLRSLVDLKPTLEVNENTRSLSCSGLTVFLFNLPSGVNAVR
jgi:hypothetical protein